MEFIAPGIQLRPDILQIDVEHCIKLARAAETVSVTTGWFKNIRANFKSITYVKQMIRKLTYASKWRLAFKLPISIGIIANTVFEHLGMLDKKYESDLDPIEQMNLVLDDIAPLMTMTRYQLKKALTLDEIPDLYKQVMKKRSEDIINQVRAYHLPVETMKAEEANIKRLLDQAKQLNAELEEHIEQGPVLFGIKRALNKVMLH